MAGTCRSLPAVQARFRASATLRGLGFAAVPDASLGLLYELDVYGVGRISEGVPESRDTGPSKV